MSLESLLKRSSIYTGRGRIPYYSTAARWRSGASGLPAARRGIYNTANRVVLSPLTLLMSSRLPMPQPYSVRNANRLSDVEDRRLFNPQGSVRWPRSLTQSDAIVTEQKPYYPVGPYKPGPFDPWWPPKFPRVRRAPDFRKSTAPAPSPWKMAFKQPSKMVICIKRKLRRMMMFTSGYAGKTGFKPAKWNEFSFVRC